MRGPDPRKPQWIREFYKNGQIEWDIPLNENGVRHGLARQYHENPANQSPMAPCRVKLTRNYVDGKEQGQEIIYYKTGEVAQVLDFVDGRAHGHLVRYGNDGQEIERAQYADGKQVKK